MLVTSKRLNIALDALAPGEVQRIPVSLSDGNVGYEILNATNVVDCIDRENSEFMVWKEPDGRQDKTGQYRMFSKLQIDPERARGRHIFRLDGWRIALVVSQDVVELFIQLQVTGASFQLLCTDCTSLH